MTANATDIGNIIRSNLTDDLRKKQYQGDPNPMTGHCYVASEAFYHLCGGKEVFTPMVMQVPTGTHWFLKQKESGAIIDLTADQFDLELDYSTARGTGFLTRLPSARTTTLIGRISPILQAIADLTTPPPQVDI